MEEVGHRISLVVGQLEWGHGRHLVPAEAVLAQDGGRCAGAGERGETCGAGATDADGRAEVAPHFVLLEEVAVALDLKDMK